MVTFSEEVTGERFNRCDNDPDILMSVPDGVECLKAQRNSPPRLTPESAGIPKVVLNEWGKIVLVMTPSPTISEYLKYVVTFKKVGSKEWKQCNSTKTIIKYDSNVEITINDLTIGEKYSFRITPTIGKRMAKPSHKQRLLIKAALTRMYISN